MAEREAQCGGPQRYAVAFGDRQQPQRPVEHRLGNRCVVVSGAGSGRGEQTGVEHPADDDATAAGGCLREQFGEPVLVQERVAAGQQHHVDVRLAHEPGGQRRLVHPDPDRADHAFGAQPLQCRVRLAQRLLGVGVRVVQQDHVDTVDAEAVQARLQGAQHPVGAEVPDPAVGGRDGEAVSEVVAGAPCGCGTSSRPTLVERV